MRKFLTWGMIVYILYGLSSKQSNYAILDVYYKHGVFVAVALILFVVYGSLFISSMIEMFLQEIQ